MNILRSKVDVYRVLAACIFISILGGTWDAWSHDAVGPHGLLSPQHLMLGIPTIIAMVVSAWAWRSYHDRWFAYLTFAFLAEPVSAPFDAWWHAYYGIELAKSPMVIWSPPHILLLSGVLVACLLVIPKIAKD